MPGHNGPQARVMTSTGSRAAASGPVRAVFPDGRWHFQHGPIDLVIGAEGFAESVAEAVEAAWHRFQSVLSELVGELAQLRSPVLDATGVTSPVARRMVVACWPHRARFITPMAAVAGAVADELIEPFRARAGVRRAYVNNGGDIALHLREGQRFRVGLCVDPGDVHKAALALDGDFEISAAMPIRGVATSGWRGRSFSLGIADSVTVLAGSAAHADAAATMVANEVDVDDPAVVRRPACELKDDTDLGGRLVTVGVGRLPRSQVEAALAAGMRHAQRLLEAGTISGAALVLQGEVRTAGSEAALLPRRASV